VGVGLGVFERYSDIKRAVKVRATFEPEEKRAREYDLLYQEFRRIYPAMSKAGRRLNAI
jgi:sugar (pentulose or hexulose) kinase